MSLEVEMPVAELRSVLTGFSRILPKSTSLPVLGCIKTTVEQGTVKMQATNLEDTVTASFSNRGNGNGAVLVPYDELNKVVKGCSLNDTIRITATKDETLINYPLGNDRVNRRVAAINVEEWPPTPAELNEPGIPVDNTLKEALGHAFDCSSDDSSRYVLQSAFLDMRDPAAHYVVGCDGRVLFSANSFRFDLKESLIVPNRRFLHWRGFLDDTNCRLSSLAPVRPKPEDKGKANVEERPGWVQFKGDRWTFMTRQIEGCEYPNWKQVCPTDWKTNVKLSAESVRFIQDVVPKMPCPDGPNNPISLLVHSGALHIASKAQESDPWTTLQVPGATSDGNPVCVTINRNFLSKAMDIGLDEIALVDNLSPIVFRKEGRRLLVMVLRPNENLPMPGNEITETAKTAECEVEFTSTVEHPAPPESTQPTQERTNNMPEQATQQEQVKPTTKSAKPQSAYEQLQQMVDGIRTALKSVVSDLNELSKTVSQAYREKRATDKEIESIRESLNEIRRLKI